MRIFLVEGVLVLAVLSVVFVICSIALEFDNDDFRRKVGIITCFVLSFICIASSCVLYSEGKKELASALDKEYGLYADSDTLSELYSYHSFGKKNEVILSDKVSATEYKYYMEQKYGKLYFYEKVNGVYEQVDLKH